MKITEYSKEQLEALEKELSAQYGEFAAKGLSLDMSRGKPGPTQLDLTNGLFTAVDETNFTCEIGDPRNYGALEGIPEIRRLFSEVYDIPAENIIVGGNSSLNIMYDSMQRIMAFGTLGSRPWSQVEGRKWICPVPGYDRHFAITELFGFEMIPVPLLEDGPNMDMVEELVKDEKVKGIWCVPLYSNPDGTCYSDETVRRLVSMDCAAEDFRIFWDNAYGIHHLYEEKKLLNVIDACIEAGHPNRVLYFASTSKVTFPGAGVSIMAASREAKAEIMKLMSVQTISFDKINQLRHARFFGNADGVRKHMKDLAAQLIPKFDIVLNTLDRELAGTGLLKWKRPAGGYFVSVDTLPGCAKETVRLAAKAGVKMTGAGATYPYGKDPMDTNIRIAPTYPSTEELQQAMDLFCVCVKLAGVRKLLEEQ
ncbi:MAG: aminotransferase class I/II-fold pyridoxal phosphate-dependent enzyme [Lachnospiraceae bacterium]|nr:aminotransferase class I/II-fold pyridoxal phosphate-dependent enzyme [Lachnospiraceae bacterium]